MITFDFVVNRKQYLNYIIFKLPLGDHLTQVAALLILNSTRVGFHLPLLSIVHTYALRSYKVLTLMPL